MKQFDLTTKTEFLQIVKNYYNNDLTVNITNFDECFKLASLHELTALFCYMLLNQTEYTSFNKQEIFKTYLSYVRLSGLLKKESEKLFDYIKNNNGEIAFFKGQFIKDFYQPFEVRSMGDVDCFIKSENNELVNEYFEKNGYKVTEYYNDVTTFTKDKVSFEVHNKINWFGVNFDELEPLTSKGFSIKFQTELTIVHALKHIVDLGCGVRQILDIALLLKNDSSCLSDIDFVNIIDSLNLTTCYNAVIGLVNRWFQTNYIVKNISDSKINVLEEAVLDGGVFGKNVNDYASVNIVKNKSKSKMIFNMLFPSYERMCKSYPILKTKKYLLFYYYLKRLIDRGLKEKRYKKISSGANIDKREIFVKELEIENQYYNKRM